MITPEFCLVVIMLIILAILVALVLHAPVPRAASDQNVSIKDLLDYRQSILAVIITAFGAWVGAGAAYYFGRENLKQSTDSMLAMREPTPKELLRKTELRDIAPRSIAWTVQESEELNDPVKKLKLEPELWFLPVVHGDGKLLTVLNEEAVWRFIDKEAAAKVPYTEVMKKTIADVIHYVDHNKGLERFKDISICATMDESAAEANHEMQQKEVHLAVIMDRTEKPTHYITTNDIRKTLLQYNS